MYYKGTKYKSQEVSDQFNWQPIELQSKEGLALINGTQFVSAYGLYSLIYAERLLTWADIIAAISFDAFDGVTDAFNEKLHAIRSHKGQVDTAARLRQLLQGSEICCKKNHRFRISIHFVVYLRCMALPKIHSIMCLMYF